MWNSVEIKLFKTKCFLQSLLAATVRWHADALKVKTWRYALRLYANDVQVSTGIDVNARVPLVLTVVYSKDCRRRQSSMSTKVRKVSCNFCLVVAFLLANSPQFKFNFGPTVSLIFWKKLRWFVAERVFGWRSAARRCPPRRFGQVATLARQRPSLRWLAR